MKKIIIVAILTTMLVSCITTSSYVEQENGYKYSREKRQEFLINQK